MSNNDIEKYNSNIERKKLNQLLSRTESEWKEFEKMDQENDYKQLLSECKLPDWAEEITTDVDPQEILPQKRKRKQMSYNENEYWKNIIEKIDDDKEANKENENKEKKKSNNRKRKRNLKMDDDNNQNDKNIDRKKRKIQK
eukprot:UN05369